MESILPDELQEKVKHLLSFDDIIVFLRAVLEKHFHEYFSSFEPERRLYI